jgi:O-antigen/teichoic acid export membrane protein
VTGLPGEPGDDRARAADDRGAVLRRRTVRGVSANLSARALAVLLSFLVTPFVLHVIGAEAYGLYAAVGALVGYGTLLDLGIAGALTKLVAGHAARDEWTQASATIAAGMRVSLVLGIAVTALGIAAAGILPGLLELRETDRGTAGILLALMAAGVGTAFVGSTASATLRGLQRHGLVSSIRVVGALLGALSSVVVVAAGFGVLGLAATSIPITLVMMGLAVLAIRRVEPRLRYGIGTTDRKTLGRVARFGRPLVLLDVAGRLQFESDEIVIAAVLPVASVAPFALAAKLSALPRAIAEPLAMVLLPLASELDARDERTRLRTGLLAGTRITIAILVPFGIALAVLAEPFLDLWVGPAYTSAAPLVLLLVLASAVDLALWPAGFVLQGLGRHQPLAWMALASGLANVAISLALVGPFGLMGVALGTLVPTSIEAAGLVLPFALRTLGIPATRFVRQALLPALLPGIPALAVLLLARTVVTPDGYPQLALLGALTVLVHGVGYLASGATRQERALIADLLARGRARIGRA